MATMAALQLATALPVQATTATSATTASDTGFASSAGVVATESPAAASAGAEMLAAGGSAVDAAIASSLAVCVVHSTSCGLGGGGFMVVWNADEQRGYALDYRETAPAAIAPILFEIDGQYEPARSRRGGLAVGVPGEVAGLFAAHRRFGRLPWKSVVMPALRLARDGFAISPHLARAIAQHRDALAGDPALSQTFLKADGTAPKAGERLRQPELATTLEAIAQQGPSAFYSGARAEALAEAALAQGGVLTTADLKAYRPVWRKPLSSSYRDARILTMPLPSSGGPTLLLALDVLEGHDLKALGAATPTSMHLLAEILKHGFAHRAAAAGDPAFDQPSPFPTAAKIARQIRSFRTFPPEAYQGSGNAARDAGTAQVSVLAADGSGVALTTTINTAFGAFVGVADTGVILNNEMDDFTFPAPNLFGLAPGKTNRIAPGKRPVSSMTPTLVIENGRASVALGGSGGPLIISATLQVLSAVLDRHATAEQAVLAPRIHHQWQPNTLLVEPEIRDIDRRALERLGHAITEIPAVASVSVAVARPGKPASGAGDPRKGGAAAFAAPRAARGSARQARRSKPAPAEQAEPTAGAPP